MGGGSPPPPPRREIVRKFVYENGIFLHIKYLLGGRLCEVAYTNPLPSLLYMFLFLLTGGGGGGMNPCAAYTLYMRVTVVHSGFVDGGQREGARRPGG